MAARLGAHPRGKAQFRWPRRRDIDNAPDRLRSRKAPIATPLSNSTRPKPRIGHAAEIELRLRARRVGHVDPVDPHARYNARAGPGWTGCSSSRAARFARNSARACATAYRPAAACRHQGHPPREHRRWRRSGSSVAGSGSPKGRSCRDRSHPRPGHGRPAPARSAPAMAQEAMRPVLVTGRIMSSSSFRSRIPREASSSVPAEVNARPRAVRVPPLRKVRCPYAPRARTG